MIKTSAVNCNPIIKIIFVILLIFLIIIPQTGCGNKEPVSKSEFCLDTACEITIYDMQKDEAQEILEETYDRIAKYEQLMSKTIEGSDVYNVNNAKGDTVEISEDTAEVIRLGLQMGGFSQGKFDITIGGVTDLWDFKSEEPKLPEKADIVRELEAVDYTKVELATGESGKKAEDPAESAADEAIGKCTVTLSDPEANIDLGGIAKGYIADCAGEFMEQKGVTKAIINLGGNITTIGEKDTDTPWNIGIERPYSDRTEIIASIQAADKTIVTSGIYERQFVKDGVRYHHVLDPGTGYPAKTDLESVTITAVKGNSGFCDGLSTTCLLLGKEKALELIEELQEKYPEKQLAAALIDKNDNIVQTDGMKLQMIEE